MIDEIIALLQQSPILHDCRVVERDQAPDGTFVLKVRCKVQARLKLQVRVRSGTAGTRYSYHLFNNAQAVIRWDNAPHYQDLENFPHHFHAARGNAASSTLSGDVLHDLSFVLIEVEKYSAPKT